MLLIRNAKLLTMGERDFPDGADLLVQDGRVVAVGADISAPARASWTPRASTRCPAS